MPLHYRVHLPTYLLCILQKKENDIDVHHYANPQVVSKNKIYHVLECRWCITEAKEHNHPFKGPKLRVEGGCFDIFVMGSNLVEPTDKTYP